MLVRTLLPCLLVIACAGDDELTTDDTGTAPKPSPTPGTSDTAPTPPGETGTPVKPDPITIVVLQRDSLGGDPPTYAPVANAVLALSGPDGSYVDTLMTDETGTVVTDLLPEGGSVSRVIQSAYTTFESVTIDTVFGVSPGNTLTFGGPDSTRNSSGNVGSVDYELSAPPSGGLFQELRVSCGGASSLVGTPASFGANLRNACVAGPVDVVAADFEDPARERARAFAVGSTVLTGTPPNLQGSVDLQTWTTDHGTINVDPGTNESTFTAGRLDRQLLTLDATRGNSPTEALVHPIFPSALIAGRRSGVETNKVVSPVPAVNQTATVAFTDSDFLPNIQIESTELAANRPSLTIDGVTASDTCSGLSPLAIAGEISIFAYYPVGFSRSWTFTAPFATTVQLPDLGPELGAYWTLPGEGDEFVEVRVIADGDHEYADLVARDQPENPRTLLNLHPGLDVLQYGAAMDSL
ncbi:MAG: hypothetical protein AAGA48_36145 [Myxococcota bacterium]